MAELAKESLPPEKLKDLLQATHELASMPDGPNKEGARSELQNYTAHLMNNYDPPIDPRDNLLDKGLTAALRVMDYGSGLVRGAVGSGARAVQEAAGGPAKGKEPVFTGQDLIDTVNPLGKGAPTYDTMAERLGIPQGPKVSDITDSVTPGGPLDLTTRGTVAGLLDMAGSMGATKAISNPLVRGLFNPGEWASEVGGKKLQESALGKAVGAAEKARLPNPADVMNSNKIARVPSKGALARAMKEAGLAESGKSSALVRALDQEAKVPLINLQSAETAGQKVLDEAAGTLGKSADASTAQSEYGRSLAPAQKDNGWSSATAADAHRLGLLEQQRAKGYFDPAGGPPSPLSKLLSQAYGGATQNLSNQVRDALETFNPGSGEKYLAHNRNAASAALAARTMNQPVSLSDRLISGVGKAATIGATSFPYYMTHDPKMLALPAIAAALGSTPVKAGLGYALRNGAPYTGQLAREALLSSEGPGRDDSDWQKLLKTLTEESPQKK